MKIIAIAAVALVVSGAGAFAQIAQQQNAQEQRIQAGARSGEMTAGEQNRMQVNEASIAREKANFRAAHGGRLTSYDRHRLEARQHRASNRIYAYKHNRRRY